jgi:hypothetical protein
LITNKIWNLTSEIHLTLTEWKPIPYIFPIRTTVRIGRGQEERILANLENWEKKSSKKQEKLYFFFSGTRGEGGAGKTVVMTTKQTKRSTGTVGEGTAGKKAKATQHEGGQSVSEKSQDT